MRFISAGESHGKGIVGILEGIPANLKVDPSKIDAELLRRQGGFGRSARQTIERDKIEFLAGIRNLKTLGSPIGFFIKNIDYNPEFMAPESCKEEPVEIVRAGHADYVGMKKFKTDDARNISERASARRTVAEVAAGGILRALFGELNVEVSGFVRRIGSVSFDGEVSFEEIGSLRGNFGMIGKREEALAKEEIERAKDKGDRLGGVIELRVRGLKEGFGSCMTKEERLNAQLSSALLEIQAIKGVEIGLGFETASRFGSEAFDEFSFERGKIVRKSNRAGGIEGGMSNGEEIVLKAAMKPIPTLPFGFDLEKKENVPLSMRADVCAVSACEVVLEAALLLKLGEIVLSRLGGDTMEELKERYFKL